MLLIPLVLLLAISLVAVGCAKPAPAPAPEKMEIVVWRYHTPHTPGRLDTAVEEDWRDFVSTETNGRVRIDVYYGNALGFKDADMLRVCGDGIVESFMIYPGYLGRDDPAIGVANVNTVALSREEYVEMMPFIRQQLTDLYAKWNIRALTLWPTPECVVCVIGKEPFTTLESMAGKKIRCWDKSQAGTFIKVGVPAQIISQAEVYLALKTGVLDGCMHYPDGVINLSFYEVCSYIAPMYACADTLGFGLNEDTWQALSPTLQTQMQDIAERFMEKYWASALDCAIIDEHLRILEKDYGMTVLEFSQADYARFCEAGVENWRELAQEAGPEAIKVQSALEAELNRVRG